MKRLLLLPVLMSMALAAPLSAANAATVGISDQQAGTFTNPLFAPLKIKHARYITPYDVMDNPVELAKLDAWIDAATRAKQRILVAFEHSRTKGKEQKAPSNSAFKKAIAKFRKAYPRVKEITVWNEVNRCQQGSRTEGQPRSLCKGTSGAKRLAGYYKQARAVFKAKGTKIAPVDVLDENNPAPAVKYIKAFKRFAKPMPKYWGIHNYSDTNRFQTKRTAALIRAIGKGREIWATETGGIVRLGKSFPTDINRASRALGCMFTIAKKFKAVKRNYVYQFNPAINPLDVFDAGLINADGTKRPGYDVVKSRKARACKK
jgi:hypothetical protein